jgi:hypothetical protein
VQARGISVKYQLSELWQDLHSQLRNKFDFINCPPRPGVLGENMGYFVINLRSPKYIHAFVQGFLQMKLFPSSMLNDSQGSHRAVSFCTFQRTARAAEEREIQVHKNPAPPPPPLYDPPLAATPTNKDKKRQKMAEYNDKRKKERMDRKERRNSLASENDTDGKRAEGNYDDEEECNEEADSDSNTLPHSSQSKILRSDPPSKLKPTGSSSKKDIDRDRDQPSAPTTSTTTSAAFLSPPATASLSQPSSSSLPTAAMKASKHVIFEEISEPIAEVKPKKKRVEAVKTSSKKDLAEEEEEEEEEMAAAPPTRSVKDKAKEKEKVKEKREKVKVEDDEDDEEKEKEKEKEKTSKKSKLKLADKIEEGTSDLSKKDSTRKDLAASSPLPDPGSDSIPPTELPLPEDLVKLKKRSKDTARGTESIDENIEKPSKRKFTDAAEVPSAKSGNEEKSDQTVPGGTEAEEGGDISKLASPRRKRVKESVVLTEGKGDGDGDGSQGSSGASAACVVDMTAIPADGEGLLKRVRGGKGRGKDAATSAPGASSSFNAIVVGKRGEIRRDTRKPVSKETAPVVPKQPPLKITVERRPRADAPNCEEDAVKEKGKEKSKQKVKDKVEKVRPSVEASGGEKEVESLDRGKEKEKKKTSGELSQEPKELSREIEESKMVKTEVTDTVIEADKDKESVKEKKVNKKQDAIAEALERKDVGDNMESSKDEESAGKKRSRDKNEDDKKAAAVETEKEKDRKSNREGVSEEKGLEWGMSDIVSAIEKRESRASLGAGTEISDKKEKRRDSEGGKEHSAALQRHGDRDLSKGKALPPQPVIETKSATESRPKYQPDSNTRHRPQGTQEGGVKSEGKDRDTSASRLSEGPRSGFSSDFTFEDSDKPSKPPITPTATVTHTASDYNSKDRERERGSSSVRAGAGQDAVSGSRRRSTTATGVPLEQPDNIVRNLSNSTFNATAQDTHPRVKGEGYVSTSSEAKKIKSESNMSGSKVSSSTAKNTSNSNRPRADSSSGYRGRDGDSGSKSATAPSSGTSSHSQNHSSGDVIQSVKAEMMASTSHSYSQSRSLKKELFKPLTRDSWAPSGTQSASLAPTPGGTQHGWVQSMVTGTWGVDGPTASGANAASAPLVPATDPSALTSNPPKPFPPQPFDPKELVYPVESTHTHF